MTAPPARNTLSGTPTNAQFNAGIGALYDYTVGLLGAAGTPAAARAALDAVGLTGNETIAGVKTFSSAPVVPGINGGQLAGFRNLLINGNFQINQRGYVSGTNVGAANTYTLDRWRVVTSGQNVTFTASGNGNQITAPAGGIEQVIESINIGGGTYVLNWTGTATATVNGTARAKGESFTLSANTNATVRLIGGTASQVQLEPGTVATPFEHRPIGAELALCQRYCYQRSGAGAYGVGQALGASTVFAHFEFPVPMRTAPTLEVANFIDAVTATGAQVLANTAGITNANAQGAHISLGMASASFTGGNAALILGNSAESRARFTSEL